MKLSTSEGLKTGDMVLLYTRYNSDGSASTSKLVTVLSVREDRSYYSQFIEIIGSDLTVYSTHRSQRHQVVNR